LVSRNRKVSKFGISCPEVHGYILNFGLLLLCNIGYEVVDKGLLFAFVEKWHRDINTFHLLVGEMTTTLDDVLSFIYISIVA